MLVRQALSILVFAAAAQPASAQAPIRPAWDSAVGMILAKTPGPLEQTLAEPDTLRPMKIGTYAKEGAIAVGLLGAVAGGLLAELGCGLSEDSNRTCTGSFLIGGVIGGAFGALPGALIGGLFPKYPKHTRLVEPEGVPDHPTE